MVVELVSGAINWDTSIFIDQFPAPGEEIKAMKVVSVPGGKGANVAVASARILGKNEVGIIGALGYDDIAQKQLKVLKQEGVDASCVKRIEGASSGQAFIVVDQNGENFILTHKAINQMMTTAMVEDEVTTSAVRNCELLVIIDPPLPIARTLISDAKTLGKAIMWSPGLHVRQGFDALKELLLKTDYVIVNESESALLTGISDSVKACMTLSNKIMGKSVIGTLGSKGCVFCWKTKTAHVPALDLATMGLRAVNTVGAGDAFLGAFAALKIKGFGDIESLFMANIAGSLKTTKEETRGSPNYSELRLCFDDQRVQLLFTRISVV